MDILQAALLGIVQGITEFIPISSSGHLDLIPRLLGWSQSTTFILFLHLGTLLALLVHFRHKLSRYLMVLIKSLRRDEHLKRKEERDFKVIRNVSIAVLPAIVLGVLLNSVISNFYDNNPEDKTITLLIIVPLLLIGILFMFEKRIFKNNNGKIEDLTLKKSFLVGLAQPIAFLRGVSRSGITLLAGQAAGLSRVEAAEFSFLMSIPVLVATSIYSIYKLISADTTDLSNEILIAMVGMVAAFISGLVAVNFLLKFLKNNSLQIFGIYRIIFAIIIFIVVFVA